jgi:hypothetical protein
MTMLGYFLVSHSGNAVTTEDLAFSIGFLAYIIVANAVSFNSNKLQLSKYEKNNIPFEPMGKHSLGRGQFINESSFLVYFGASKIIGFLVPLILVFAGPSDVAVMLTPSLVVVVAQAVAEQSTGSFHDVLRIIVPIGYSSYRLFGPLKSWALNSWIMYLEKQPAGEFIYTFNFLLAWANLTFAFWNLFGFLLLRALPLYFDKEETPRVEMAYTLLPIPKKNKIKV